MSTVQNNFDGGTSGGTIGASNSGGASGNAFNTVTGPFVYDTTGALSALGGRVQIASSTAWRSYLSWGSVSSLAARMAFTFNGTVPASTTVGSCINSAFATVFKFSTSASRGLAIQDAASATLGTSAALTADTTYEIEYQIQPGATTSTGSISAQFYAASAPGTLLLNYNSGTANLGTVQALVRGQNGNHDTVTSLDITFDDIVYNTGTLNPIGAPPIPASVPAPQLSVMRTEVISRSHGRLTNR